MESLPALLDELRTDSLAASEKLKTWLAKESDVKNVAKLAKQLSAAQDSLKKCRDGETITLALQNEYASAKLRCQRRGGELLKAMDKRAGARGKGKKVEGHDDPPLLQDALGVDSPDKARNTSKRWQKIASVPQEEFDALIDVEKQTAADEEITANSVLVKANQSQILAKHFSGDVEWYTPEKYIEKARQVLGDIDVDPATSGYAQKVVKADLFYTADDSGLDQDWYGRVWLNPPYKMPLIEQFVFKLCEHVEAGDVKAAVLLTNNCTDPKWWQRAARLATCVCFTAGRISFYNQVGEFSSPTNGQTFFYFGRAVARFRKHFDDVGVILSCQ